MILISSWRPVLLIKTAVICFQLCSPILTNSSRKLLETFAATYTKPFMVTLCRLSNILKVSCPLCVRWYLFRNVLRVQCAAFDVCCGACAHSALVTRCPHSAIYNTILSICICYKTVIGNHTFSGPMAKESSKLSSGWNIAGASKNTNSVGISNWRPVIYLYSFVQ